MRKGEKGKVGGSKRRLSPSVRCFVQAAAEALDKNSPNPSLITMPVKSEILTAAAAWCCRQWCAVPLPRENGRF